MVNKYNHQETEEKIRKFWDKERIYKFDPEKKGKVFSIDTPPPYASAGHLHVGHALHYTQFEIIARIMRMMGMNVYFAPGYDDNGLPTEKYVEEKLGINKSKIDRTKFRKICLKESKKVEDIYTENVLKKLGHSYDWDLLYQTISPEAQKVSQTSFLRLVKKQECYRGKEPTIWCPYHETALAQAEVEDLKRTTKLNYVEFGDKERVLIATTRPEFLGACVGIFVNPNDKKNKKLIGKELLVPIFNYKVKVIADETVDPSFGTGVLMACTFGDNADIEKYKKYNLDLKIILNEKGKLNENAGKFKGMDLEQARQAILKELDNQGRLKKQEPLEQTTGSCWRCNTPVEYIITDQWFINTLKHKKKLLEMGNKINWYPKFMKVRYNDWVKNLAWNWTISRQRYYGVPIPVWYCNKCGKIILPEEKELPIDPTKVRKKCECGGEGIAEEDVFDTWMTSSNSPEIALKWLENPKQYEKLAPMSLRPQSHDIIRTWAFYTILKSYLLFNRIPWKDVMIGTFILDPKGKGMSKSKGNAIWADDLIKKYSVDIFRYWVGSASIGNDLPFNEDDLIAGKKFITKLFNASKFVFTNLRDYNYEKPELLDIDKYMLEKIKQISKKAKEQYLKYDIAGAKRTIENLFWHDFADNYIEIVKKRIYNNKKGKQSAQYTLYKSFLAILKLIAPIMPFITEEIYQEYFKKTEEIKSIHLTKFEKIESKEDKKIKENGDLFIKILTKTRQEKSNNKKSMNAKIILTLEKDKIKKLGEMLEDLKDVTNCQDIKEGKFNVKFL
jgi:valyl-tRNA synthetase